MADEANTPEPAPTVSVEEIEALLDKYSHDFIGKAHEIVQGLKSLVFLAKHGVEVAAEKIEEAAHAVE